MRPLGGGRVIPAGPDVRRTRRSRAYASRMESLPGRCGQAHLSSWEQECCGSALARRRDRHGARQSASTMDEDMSGAPVDWHILLHDDGPGIPPAHRTLVYVERVQEVRLLRHQVSADGVSWVAVPGSAGLSDAGSVLGHGGARPLDDRRRRLDRGRGDLGGSRSATVERSHPALRCPAPPRRFIRRRPEP